MNIIKNDNVSCSIINETAINSDTDQQKIYLDLAQTTKVPTIFGYAYSDIVPDLIESIGIHKAKKII